MTNPLDQIEDEKAQRDIGVVSFRIFQGARSDGASRYDAFTILCAWFYAMCQATKTEEEDD